MSSNTSDDEEQYEQKWQCDLCKTALFDTYDEAIEHEQNCGVINIRYEDGNNLGLTLVCNRKDDTRVFQYVPNQLYLMHMLLYHHFLL